MIVQTQTDRLLAFRPSGFVHNSPELIERDPPKPSNGTLSSIRVPRATAPSIFLHSTAAERFLGACVSWRTGNLVVTFVRSQDCAQDYALLDDGKARAQANWRILLSVRRRVEVHDRQLLVATDDPPRPGY